MYGTLVRSGIFFIAADDGGRALGGGCGSVFGVVNVCVTGVEACVVTGNVVGRIDEAACVACSFCFFSSNHNFFRAFDDTVLLLLEVVGF